MKEAMAKGYGDALFEIGIEQNKLEEFRKQCDLVKATLNDEFMSLLSHPKIKKEEKKECLVNVYGQACDPLFLNFMKVMIDKNRINIILEAFDEFIADYLNYHHIEIAEVTSAFPLNEEDKKRIHDVLEKSQSQKIECRWKVDESLLAGLRVRINDQILDNSAANQLARLKEECVKAALK